MKCSSLLSLPLALFKELYKRLHFCVGHVCYDLNTEHHSPVLVPWERSVMEASNWSRGSMAVFGYLRASFNVLVLPALKDI